MHCETNTVTQSETQPRARNFEEYFINNYAQTRAWLYQILPSQSSKSLTKKTNSLLTCAYREAASQVYGSAMRFPQRIAIGGGLAFLAFAAGTAAMHFIDSSKAEFSLIPLASAGLTAVSGVGGMVKEALNNKAIEQQPNRFFGTDHSPAPKSDPSTSEDVGDLATRNIKAMMLDKANKPTRLVAA